jgi:hypothetical protein
MKIPARRAMSATVFLAFLYLKILIVLLLIYSLLTPRLGHRKVYFGQLESGKLEMSKGKWERKGWEEKKSNDAEKVQMSLANLNSNKTWPVDEPSGEQRVFGKESSDYWHCLGILAREWPGAKCFLVNF